MNLFRRTISGLNNQHLFYQVDLIAYLEGGPTTFAKVDVYAGNHSTDTEDIIYWSRVFEKFVPQKKLKFKSIGSKTTILEIANDIVSGVLTTTVVAMDNEFDEVLNQRIVHPKVFYTYGYSWENDIWNKDVVSSVVEELTAAKRNNFDIEINLNNFFKKIKIGVYADCHQFQRGASFFPRQTGHMFCVDCVPAYLPTIKTTAINARISSMGLKKSTLYAFGRRKSLDPSKFLYGHFLAEYCYHLIYNYIKKKHQLKQISKDIVYRIGLNRWFKDSFSEGPVFNHHLLQFGNSGL